MPANVALHGVLRAHRLGGAFAVCHPDRAWRRIGVSSKKKKPHGNSTPIQNPRRTGVELDLVFLGQARTDNFQVQFAHAWAHDKRVVRLVLQRM